MDTLSSRRVQRVRHELRRRELQVSGVRTLGPGFVEVRFGGEELAGFVSLSFDDHVKFMIPGADGEWVRRDYTPRRFDAARHELAIEFALHGDGVASEWARQARPGQRALVGGPRGSMVIAPDHDWHLLAGDATALPAIHRRVEELPAGSRAIVRVLLDDAADERVLESAAALDVQWLHDAPSWLESLRRLQLPAGEGFAWGGGEAQLMRSAREILVQQHGLPREQMRISAYWKRGASDFHEPIED